MYEIFIFFFFFQAEDGIRDTSVTGVQTCALPIFGDLPAVDPAIRYDVVKMLDHLLLRQDGKIGGRTGQRVKPALIDDGAIRSEERRVGKECRYRGAREC